MAKHVTAVVVVILALVCGAPEKWMPSALAAPADCRAGSADGNALLSKIGNIVSNYLQQHNDPQGGWLSAMAIAVVSPGHRQIINCGVTSLAGGPPVDSQTIYEIGSESKVFTATALAGMVSGNLVGLDDTLSKYFTGPLPPASCQTPAITLKMLATHNAGLPDSPRNITWGGKDPQGHEKYSRADMLDSFTHGFANPCAAIESTPGTKWSYSNWGFAMLGQTMADKYFQTQHPSQPLPAVPAYGQLIHDFVTGPLGMNDTQLEPDPPSGAEAQPTCKPKMAAPCFWLNNNAYAGGGGLVSTINDMATFVEANLGLPRNPSNWPAIKMTHRGSGHGRGCRPDQDCQGLGWGILEPGPQRISPKFITLEKDGGTNGFASNTWFMPAACWGLTMLTNSWDPTVTEPGSKNSVMKQVFDAVGPQDTLCAR